MGKKSGQFKPCRSPKPLHTNQNLGSKLSHINLKKISLKITPIIRQSLHSLKDTNKTSLNCHAYHDIKVQKGGR